MTHTNLQPGGVTCRLPVVLVLGVFLLMWFGWFYVPSVVNVDINLVRADLPTLRSSARLIHKQRDLHVPPIKRSFNITGTDVLVFLHIQKTGGSTFESHLLQHILPCCYKKRNVFAGAECGRECLRPDSDVTFPLTHPIMSHSFPVVGPFYLDRDRTSKNTSKTTHQRLTRLRRGRLKPFWRRSKSRMNSVWMFQRFTVGWPCGIHPDWTQLHACLRPFLARKNNVTNQRLVTVTYLRHPVARVTSEYLHKTQVGADWKDRTRSCAGRQVTRRQMPNCGINRNTSFMTFVSCKSNWANNRQTRMLADLRLVGCYKNNYPNRSSIMLESAKRNLKAMHFFGLTEHQEESQYIFERSLGLRFSQPFVSHTNRTRSTTFHLNDKEMNVTLKNNKMDLELYAFAKNLFWRRYRALKALDND